MKYEFILKERKGIFGRPEQIGKIVVPETFWEEQKKRYEHVMEVNKKAHPDTEYILLINKLNDDGEFEEVVQ